MDKYTYRNLSWLVKIFRRFSTTSDFNPNMFLAVMFLFSGMLARFVLQMRMCVMNQGPPL